MAADRLDDPRRQVRKVLRHTPAATRGAVIKPSDLGEAVPFVVDEILVFDARAGFEHDNVDAFLGKFVCQRAAASAGADDDDNAVVIEIIRCRHDIPPNRS